MVGRLHEKVALVVGAGSVGPGWGNGKAAAVLFAREGAKVLCADVNEDAANETVQLIRQENGMANATCADVTSHDDIRRMVKACTDIYGRIERAGITTLASPMSEASWSCPKGVGPIFW